MRRAPALSALFLAVALTAAACGGGDSGSGADPDGGGSDDTTTTTPTYADLNPADITFNPVLEIVGCDGTGVPGAGTATTEASTSSTVPGVDGTLCYVLGPVGGDGTDLRDAKVYADGVGIEVAVREDSIEALNPMFAACFETGDDCPASSSEDKGYVAIVVDGRVISTPAVNEPDLASSPFVITGDFDKAQATNIAAAINGS